jgi:hypothetical protein
VLSNNRHQTDTKNLFDHFFWCRISISAPQRHRNQLDTSGIETNIPSCPFWQNSGKIQSGSRQDTAIDIEIAVGANHRGELNGEG